MLAGPLLPRPIIFPVSSAMAAAVFVEPASTPRMYFILNLFYHLFGKKFSCFVPNLHLALIFEPYQPFRSPKIKLIKSCSSGKIHILAELFGAHCFILFL